MRWSIVAIMSIVAGVALAGPNLPGGTFVVGDPSPATTSWTEDFELGDPGSSILENGGVTVTYANGDVESPETAGYSWLRHIGTPLLTADQSCRMEMSSFGAAFSSPQMNFRGGVSSTSDQMTMGLRADSYAFLGVRDGTTGQVAMVEALNLNDEFGLSISPVATNVIAGCVEGNTLGTFEGHLYLFDSDPGGCDSSCTAGCGWNPANHLYTFAYDPETSDVEPLLSGTIAGISMYHSGGSPVTAIESATCGDIGSSSEPLPSVPPVLDVSTNSIARTSNNNATPAQACVSVTNGGSGTLDWDASFSTTPPDCGGAVTDWVTIDAPTSGTGLANGSPDQLCFSFANAASCTTEATFQAVVEIDGTNGSPDPVDAASTPQQITIDLTVSTSVVGTGQELSAADGIFTFNLSQEETVGQYLDGTFWCLDPEPLNDSVGCQVDSIAPAMTGTGTNRRNGHKVNFPHSNFGTGENGRVYLDGRQCNRLGGGGNPSRCGIGTPESLPIVLNAGDVLVKAQSNNEACDTSLGNVPGSTNPAFNTCLTATTALTVVSQDPSAGCTSGVLRPPYGEAPEDYPGGTRPNGYCWDGAMSRLSQGYSTVTNQVDAASMVAALSAWGRGYTDMNQCMGQDLTTAACDTTVFPEMAADSFNERTYSASRAMMFNAAMMISMQTYSEAQREIPAQYMAQVGLDQYGAYIIGDMGQSWSGGIQLGSITPIVYAGHVLNQPSLWSTFQGNGWKFGETTMVHRHNLGGEAVFGKPSFRRTAAWINANDADAAECDRSDADCFDRDGGECEGPLSDWIGQSVFAGAPNCDEGILPVQPTLTQQRSTGKVSLAKYQRQTGPYIGAAAVTGALGRWDEWCGGDNPCEFDEYIDRLNTAPWTGRCVSYCSPFAESFYQTHVQGMAPTPSITGLQTEPEELDRFIANLGGEPYDTLATDLQSDAVAARDSWAFNLQSGSWESDAGNCEPMGATEAGTEFDIREAATDILALALNGYIDSDNTYYAAARTRILEFAAMTDFSSGNLSGSNQCALDLGSAAYHVLEAALLLENAGYSSWSASDKTTLATWAAEEAFPVLSWGIEARKNNWGIVMFGSALAAAHYADGVVSPLRNYDTTSIVPSDYITDAGTRLATWLSATAGDELDSQCSTDSQVFGLQSYGGFPDDLRRTGGTFNCGQTTMDYDCTSSTSCGSGHFYQQKSANAMARVCEILRRIGDTASCFELTSHGGDDTALVDAAEFATGGNFQTYYVNDFAQGLRYVAGYYYQNAGLYGALTDGSVPIHGGRDYAYTAVTHADGVAYTAAAP